MSSVKRSLSLTYQLAEAAQCRATDLGYPSTNAYWRGLLRLDLMHDPNHAAPRQIADTAGHIQDRADTQILARWRARRYNLTTGLHWRATPTPCYPEKRTTTTEP